VPKPAAETPETQAAPPGDDSDVER
jgi:hypothetical protein